jgi:hypothetical protein
MRVAWIAFAAALAAAVASAPLFAPAQVPLPTAPLPSYKTLTPMRVLGLIRRVYREHRPPPPYEVYTMVKKTWTSDGYPDYADTYTKKYWVRNTDRAALVRYVYRDGDEGDLSFDRPALNQDRDPGPPTADLFEPAHPEPVSFVPTPEPTMAAEQLKTIAAVTSYYEPDYYVKSLTLEGGMLHLVLQPKRDPERNVLREIWVDKDTYVLKKVIAHDRMFIDGTDHIYPMRVVYTLGYLDGYVVVTHFEGTVLSAKDPDYSFEADTGDSPTVSIDFQDISFPSSLPAWYFNPRDYAQNLASAPE